MNNTKKTLTRYQRKRFFYKFFLRGSPRNSAIFGLGWIALCFVLPPFLFWILRPGTWAWHSDAVRLVAVMGLTLLTLFIAILYGMIVLGYAYMDLLRLSQCPPWFRKVSILGALFPGIGGLFVGMVLWWRKRRGFTSFAIASVVVGICSLLIRFGLIPLPIHPYGWWLLSLGGFVALLVAICVLPDRHRLRAAAFLPLAAVILGFVGLQMYHIKLNRDIVRSRNEISRTLGRSIELADFWNQEEAGFPLTSEPLNTLIQTKPENMNSVNLLKSPAQQKKSWAEFQQKNPKFLAALNEFTRLAPQRIRHDHTDETLASLLLLELNTFRNSADALALQMVAHADDPAVVRDCNRKLIRLRDFPLNSYSLIAKMVAGAIEAIRLEALTAPLAAGTFRANEWPELLGAPPPWGKAFADAMGDEATMFESVLRLFGRNGMGSLIDSPNHSWQNQYQSAYPLFLAIHFQRDYLFALGKFAKLIPEFQSGAGIAMERSRHADMGKLEIKDNMYILSAMLLPALDACHIKVGEIEGRRRMFEIAVAVMAYQKQHGRLPENLRFLPQTPLDPVTGNVIGYEAGILNFYDHDKKTHSRYGFRLFLPYDKKQASCADGLKAKTALGIILENVPH